MRTASPYSASITGGGFLFNETNALLPSLLDEMSIVRKRPVQKTMGYVNMFNRGVGEVQKQLKESGNTPAIFNIDNLTAFEAIVYRRSNNHGIKSKVPSQGTSQGTSHGKGTKSEIADIQTNIQDDMNKGTKSEVPSQGKGTKSRTENVVSTSRKDGHTVIEGNIIAFCSKPRSLKEIAEYLGVSAFKKVKTRYINELLKEGRLSMTVPDKPTSRFQKYVAI